MGFCGVVWDRWGYYGRWDLEKWCGERSSGQHKNRWTTIAITWAGKEGSKGGDLIGPCPGLVMVVVASPPTPTLAPTPVSKARGRRDPDERTLLGQGFWCGPGGAVWETRGGGQPGALSWVVAPQPRILQVLPPRAAILPLLPYSGLWESWNTAKLGLWAYGAVRANAEGVGAGAVEG